MIDVSGKTFVGRKPSEAKLRFQEVAALYQARFGHPCEILTNFAPDTPRDADYELITAELLACLEGGTPHPVCKARRDRILEQLCSGVFEYNRWGEIADQMDILECDLTSRSSLAEHRRAVFAAIDELTPDERERIPEALRKWWRGDEAIPTRKAASNLMFSSDDELEDLQQWVAEQRKKRETPQR